MSASKADGHDGLHLVRRFVGLLLLSCLRTIVDGAGDWEAWGVMGIVVRLMGRRAI